jgi:hypothetical protein
MERNGKRELTGCIAYLAAMQMKINMPVLMPAHYRTGHTAKALQLQRETGAIP